MDSFGQKNRIFSKQTVVKHFVASGFPRKTVYKILARTEHGEDLSGQAGSDRPAVKLPAPAKGSSHPSSMWQNRHVPEEIGSQV